MYEINETEYGYHLIFEGFFKREDMELWLDDIKKTVSSQSGPYGVLVDLRHAAAFPAEAQEVLMEGINYCLSQGMERNAVIVSNAIAKIQASRIAKESGMAANVRYIDASANPDWEKMGTEWITQAADPEQVAT